MGWKYKSNTKSIKAALTAEVAKANRKTGEAIVRGTSSRVPRRTGALAASMYVIDTTKQAGYTSAKSAAIAANPAVAQSIEPQITLPTPFPGVVLTGVASAVVYAERIEKGGYSHDGYQAPKPFLNPSAEEQRPQHEIRVRNAISKVENGKQL